MKDFGRMVYLKFARRHENCGDLVSVPSIIGEGADIKGNLNSKGTVHVDGKVVGDLHCEEVVIGINGNIKGRVFADKFHIYGTFEGSADVNSLFVARSAKVIGDINHVTIAIEPGAYIDGRCIRKDRDVSALTSSSAGEKLLQGPSSSRKKA